MYSIEGLLIIGFLSYIFYQSLIAFIILLPGCVFILREKKKRKIAQQKMELNNQFKEGILAISAALKAGYSMENACREACKDMQLLYGEHAFISKELAQITTGIANNVTIEKLWENLGVRSDLTDIKDFAEIFVIAKRSSGNINTIIRNTVKIMSDKIEVKRDIQTLISAKKFEQRIMNMIPFFIIIFISISSPGFFHVLYHNVVGVITMTICLILYVIAYIIAKKIIEIEV